MSKIRAADAGEGRELDSYYAAERDRIAEEENKRKIRIIIRSAIYYMTDPIESQDGLSLFKELFAQGQGFDEAIEAASKGIVQRNETIKWHALELFRELFAKGYGFAQAEALLPTLADDDFIKEQLRLTIAVGKMVRSHLNQVRSQ